MVDLPKKKVGIIACSGEELPEGTVTRLAALHVLEQLRPGETVTICLPLFLAGGEGDRAFARFYPTITIDGCPLRCAAHGTELYSNKPAASIVISELVAKNGLQPPQGKRRLDEAGRQAVEAASTQIADLVDEILEKPWSRRQGDFIETAPAPDITSQGSTEETCSCGSGIPVRKVLINNQEVILTGLSLILEQFFQEGKPPTEETARELFETVKIYNRVPDGAEESYTSTLLQEYRAFLVKERGS